MKRHSMDHSAAVRRGPLPVFFYIESNTRLNWIQRAIRRTKRMLMKLERK